MGASNFHNEFASRIYVFAGGDDDTQTIYDYDDAIANVKASMKFEGSVMYAGKKFKTKFAPDGKDPLELRSYPSKIIGTLYDSTQIAGREVSVHVTAIARSGYYNGYNFDYFCWFEVDWEEVELQEIIDNEAIAWLVSAKNHISNRLEEIYAANCDEILLLVATFSNGETIYKIDN